MAVAADSCSELGCGDPSMSLAWSACRFCSSQRCRAAAENLAVEGWKVAVRLWAAKSWSETFLFILFRHKQRLGGNHFWSFTKSVWVLNHWPAGQRLHALFSPWRIKSIVVLELQVQPGFQRLLAFEAKYAASECLLLVALWLFTLYFHFVRLTKWDGKQQVTQLVMGQSQDPSSFNFPNCCGLGKALPNGRSAQETISCSLSWRSSHEIQITDPSHPLLTCFLCSSYIWMCDFMPWGSIFVKTCPKVDGMLRLNLYVIPLFGWTGWCNEQLGVVSALLLSVTALRINVLL